MTSHEETLKAEARLDRRLAWSALGVLLVWLYGPQMVSMVAVWEADPNYSHGFFVPLVSLWLVWRRWPEHKAAVGDPGWWGVAVVIPGLLILVAGSFGHEFFLQRISLLPVLWGLVLLLWGFREARMAVFPVAYLGFMIPLPYVLYDTVAFPLRFVAASLAGWGIGLTGIPVLVEGNVITVPHAVLDVVDACSGIRSLVSLAAAGVILAYLFLPRMWARVALVVLVLPVAVFTNGLRVMITGVLVEKVSPDLAHGASHDLVGWAVFMAAFLILFGLAALLRRLSGPGEVKA